jgi:hypothetical protein
MWNEPFNDACPKYWLCYRNEALERNRHSTMRLAKSSLAGLLAVLILLVSALACNSTFHQCLHADACHSDHHCALCLFLHGQIDAADVAPIQDSMAASLVASQPVMDSFEISSLDLRLSPSRAPPSC